MQSASEAHLYLSLTENTVQTDDASQLRKTGMSFKSPCLEDQPHIGSVAFVHN